MTIWADGVAYERYVGRWSRLVAPEFVDWLGLPAGRSLLDAGCGTGVLSGTLLGALAPRAVTGLDASAGFVRRARAVLSTPALRLTLGDAQRLPFRPGVFDGTVSGLLLNFLRSPQRALAEWGRVTRPGGTVAAYVWDYAAGMGLMRHFWDVAAELDPAARERDEARRSPVCQPGPLADLFRGAGLDAVAVREIVVPTPFRDFEDYWSPFLAGQGPAPAYAMSLPESRRTALRERLRERLPVAQGGEIRLTARAWAVRGTVR